METTTSPAAYTIRLSSRPFRVTDEDRKKAVEYLRGLPRNAELDLSAKWDDPRRNEPEWALETVTGEGPEWFCKRTGKLHWTAGELADHCEALLNNKVPRHTPWGAVQTIHHLAPGIVQVGTASHGGIHLERSLNGKVPAYMRNDEGWYEEDVCWCRVVVVFPEYFSSAYQESAKDTLKRWEYREYEKFYGITLQPGESCEKDRGMFLERNKDSWLCISAITSAHFAGYVEVTAAVGGRPYFTQASLDPNRRDVSKVFYVPADEYAKRDTRIGIFVVDPNRHVSRDQLDLYEGRHAFACAYRRPGEEIETMLFHEASKKDALSYANNVVRRAGAGTVLEGCRALTPEQSAKMKTGAYAVPVHAEIFEVPDSHGSMEKTSAQKT